MADNFNLRSFLAENRLTKNAQLLKEEESQKQEVYYDDILFHIHARYPNLEAAIQGVEDYLENRNGVVTFEQWKEAELDHLNFDGPCYFLMGPNAEPGQQPPLLVSVRDEDLVTDPQIVAQYKAEDAARGKGEEGDNLNEGSDYGFEEVMDAIADDFTPGTPEFEQMENAVQDAFYNGQVDTSEFGHDPSAPSREMRAIAKQIGLDETVSEEPTMKEASNSKEAQHLKKGDIITSGDEVVSVSAGAKTPAGKVEVTLKTKSGKTKVSVWGKTTKIGVKSKETVNEISDILRGFLKGVRSAVQHEGTEEQVNQYVNSVESNMRKPNGHEKYMGWEENDYITDFNRTLTGKTETMKETKLTAKERRLVEMVQRALGEENVDYTMGRQDDPNQLANPAPELNIPEGDESIEEVKPLPKYESIEELMKEIEHGTNEAAHKYKMEEMKRVYEALEAKVGSLEEGENAEHIDQKKVKQMRKDIAALRKAEERLRKDFDKKFNKEKKEAPKKEKEVVALAEGNFDLRKFLAENRK